MKFLVAILIIFFLILLYQFWFAQGNVADVVRYKNMIEKQERVNKALKGRNALLIATIKKLRKNEKVFENRARYELGMVKKGEEFYQVLK